VAGSSPAPNEQMNFCSSPFHKAGRRRDYPASASRRKASAVAVSAGRKASIAISDSVMSTGVPNTVVMLISDKASPSISRRSGTTMSSYSPVAKGWWNLPPSPTLTLPRLRGREGWGIR
jgi:hypothetical protein